MKIENQQSTLAVRPPEYFPGLPFMALFREVDRFVLADPFEYSRRSRQNRARPVHGGVQRDVPQHHEGRRQQDAPPARLCRAEWQKLGPCACASVRLLAQGAGLETTITRATALPGAPATLPAILRALEDEPEALLAPPDAAAHDAALLDEADGIDCEVRVARFDAPRYHQHFDGFVAGLSFADLLFEYGPEARALLREGSNVEG
ncbi:MAG: hypothetical protein BRD29_03300 [Bacteroidetes bacterium QH_2_67_10]|nr:MAG: hypothetical protein BRD29_03300 [Bacteroidetes bacterium QH_2_67_10]